jgi:hypothetical protein
MPLWAFTALIAMGLTLIEVPLWLRVVRCAPGSRQRTKALAPIAGLLLAELLVGYTALGEARTAFAHPTLRVSVPLVLAGAVFAAMAVIALGLLVVELRQQRRSGRRPTGAS